MYMHMYMYSLYEDPHSLAYVEVNHSCRSYYIYNSCGDFVQVNSNITDKTAGEVELVLCANNASVEVIEPRTSWNNYIWIYNIMSHRIWVDTTLAPEQGI